MGDSAFTVCVVQARTISRSSFLCHRPLRKVQQHTRVNTCACKHYPHMQFTLHEYRHDALLTVAVAVASSLWLFLWQQLTTRNVVPSTVTRKVVHISCGPLLIMLWPFYSNLQFARYIAATVPFIVFMRLRFSSNSSLARAISRTGDESEAREGPLYYVMVLIALNVFLWKDIAAAVAVAQLCFGDGFAEIIGRKFGQNSKWTLPFKTGKSVAGSFAFVTAAFVASFALLKWFDLHGLYVASMDNAHVALVLLAVSVACAAVELLPKNIIGDDNVAIALVASALTKLLIG